MLEKLKGWNDIYAEIELGWARPRHMKTTRWWPA
jgi:hypothetical protein